MLIVAVDADDTALSFNPALLGYYNKKDRTSYTSMDIKSYDLEKLWRCTKDEANARIREFYRSEEFTNIVPVVGAQEWIDVLKEKYKLIILTSRATELRRSTEESIERFFPGRFSDIYYTGEWSSIKGRGDKKAHICEQKGVYANIDDCLEYILACQKVRTRGIIFDLDGNYGWNKTEEKVERALSWKEAVEKIN
nr:hypothetical protein [Nanoarchaeum sp.]